VPAKLITLLGPDREMFLKGRRAESQGMGIGAFAYYRRVVERQKDRIFGEILRVAKRISASPEIIQDLEDAKQETQFSKAVERIKHGIPESLKINNHNPLTLLHTALSEGLHSQDDDQCLELAHSVRIVLTDLAARMAEALRDDDELKGAVSRLLRPPAQSKSIPTPAPIGTPGNNAPH